MSSKKLRSARADQGDDLSIDMSPMIDMVFLLLIFFLVTATAVIVKQDPEVEPPIAAHSERAKDAKGRIVINIRQDGDFTTENKQPLEGDDAIAAYIKEEERKIDRQGYTPMLHLRGHKSAVFKHARRVIRISADNGVEEVKFATYPFSLE